MSKHRVPPKVPAYMTSGYALVNRAFPEGIADETYWPLLSILGEEMSDRSVARLISYVTEREYANVLHDMLRVQSTDAPSAEEIKRVKDRLRACGVRRMVGRTGLREDHPDDFTQ
jgi:Protein of unknown function (DUF3349)